MKSGNAAVELAQESVELEREAGIGRARAALPAGPGRLVCDCGDEISQARRLAVPGTDKCIDCATRFEQRRRIA